MKESNLYDSGMEEESQTFYELQMQVLGMIDKLWDRVRGSGSELWIWCELF